MRTHTFKFAAVAALFAASLSSIAFASPGVGVSTSPQAGNILVDDRGMTLYRYAADPSNVSTCYDACAQAWPPLLVDAVPATPDSALAADLGVIARTDGTQQLAYRGAPLYYFVDDAQPGDTTGQGSGGVWFVVNPA